MTRSNETCSKCGGNRWNGTVVGDYCLRCDGTGVDPKYGSGDMKALVAEVERLRAENRKLRDVLQWTNDQCPGKCSAVCDKALHGEHRREEKR
jgi:hypothetical protein